ncbi:MAG: ATP-binding protein [Prevotellaceae bacterium]|jgi:DNA transposition AAA+ family ATPase|nr:ATP-binding protein [Prevotellaceae bacterium]
MITKEFKQKIVKAIKGRLLHYKSAAKMAVALGINGAQLSRIQKGELDNVLSDANWISIARKLDVQLHEETAWKTAKTPVFMHVYTQLQACQSGSLSGLLCDMADIGKTYTAQQYVKENRMAVYIDCSQYKSKYQLMRAIAREFGVGSAGRYADMYADLVFYLKSIPNPLIILDEAGDLSYAAFLELKAIWNATEGFCGWYMMGADGLRRKIENNILYKKVGYAEIFSRFGSRYQKITPDGREALEEFQNTQVAMIAKVNNEKADVKAVVVKTGGSLRRVRIELRKTA